MGKTVEGIFEGILKDEERFDRWGARFRQQD